MLINSPSISILAVATTSSTYTRSRNVCHVDFLAKLSTVCFAADNFAHKNRQHVSMLEYFFFRLYYTYSIMYYTSVFIVDITLIICDYRTNFILLLLPHDTFYDNIEKKNDIESGCIYNSAQSETS